MESLEFRRCTMLDEIRQKSVVETLFSVQGLQQRGQLGGDTRGGDEMFYATETTALAPAPTLFQ